MANLPKMVAAEELNHYLPNGCYKMNADRKYFNEFGLEKDMVEYVCDNIEFFMGELCDDEVLGFEVDTPIRRKTTMSPAGRRMDIFVKGKKSDYIIECKNRDSSNTLRTGIGQLLDYRVEVDAELILLSTLYDYNIMRAIEFHNLPIRYIVLTKRFCLDLQKTFKENNCG